MDSTGNLCERCDKNCHVCDSYTGCAKLNYECEGCYYGWFKCEVCEDECTTNQRFGKFDVCCRCETDGVLSLIDRYGVAVYQSLTEQHLNYLVTDEPCAFCDSLLFTYDKGKTLRCPSYSSNANCGLQERTCYNCLGLGIFFKDMNKNLEFLRNRSIQFITDNLDDTYVCSCQSGFVGNYVVGAHECYEPIPSGNAVIKQISYKEWIQAGNKPYSLEYQTVHQYGYNSPASCYLLNTAREKFRSRGHSDWLEAAIGGYRFLRAWYLPKSASITAEDLLSGNVQIPRYLPIHV